MRDSTYEELRNAIRSVEPDGDANSRSVRWLEASRSLAIARDHQGRIELFLLGEELATESLRVREHLVFDRWNSREDGVVLANRIVLSSGDEYDAAAALICVELLDRGFADDQQGAFTSAEPVIEMVLAEVQSASELVTGLAGELQTLVNLLDAADSAETDTILDGWHGWDRSTRDFQLGPVGVEVKTTTTGASIHSIEGWQQIECGIAADGQVETSLRLLSMGIRWLPHEGELGLTIETLVQRVLDYVQPQHRGEFIDRVRGFAGASFEIELDGRCGDPALRRPFMPVFERLYDFGDERIRVLRSEDLAHLSHVQIDSVRFAVQLPEKVRGDVNPVSNLDAIAPFLLALMRE
ncbi:PD-(D/E)XK motif protein [Agrococcus jejuensis]|uniref:PD-(D/E)XK motif protein n=1 Tax=Agrococcus jejuensis TaxID=399736 RepID=UPI0016426E80|nr:PD-(D/E)XK motif protein [Agrococcus jejuensis]